MAWKEVQFKRKIKKRNQLAIVVLGVVLGLLVISWTIRLTQNFFGSKKYTWDRQFNINLLIRTPATSILSYSPKENRVVVVDVPDEIFLEVPHGFGSWQLRAVYGLGGNQLLKDALAAFFAIPIDGYLDFSSLKSSKSAAEIVQTLRKSPISGFNLLSALQTDLTMWELLQLKVGISSVRFDKIRSLDLVRLDVLDKGQLPDGTAIFTADPVRLDSVLADFQDPTILSQSMSIAVLNATGKPQLAQKWARLITNLGGNVIIIGNAPNTLKKTQVVGEESALLKRLRQIFNDLDCQSNPKCDRISPTEDISSRAQINVFLGEDL